METLTSPREDRTGTLWKPGEDRSGWVAVPAAPQTSWFTSELLQLHGWRLFIIYKNPQNILMSESPYPLWFRRAALSTPNPVFSLTFLRGDVTARASLQIGYVAFKELEKLFWRRSWRRLPLTLVSLSSFPTGAHPAQRPRPH